MCMFLPCGIQGVGTGGIRGSVCVFGSTGTVQLMGMHDSPIDQGLSCLVSSLGMPITCVWEGGWAMSGPVQEGHLHLGSRLSEGVDT